MTAVASIQVPWVLILYTPLSARAAEQTACPRSPALGCGDLVLLSANRFRFATLTTNVRTNVEMVDALK